MRLKQHIQESYRDIVPDPETWEDIKEKLDKNCKPFLKELNLAEQLVYRGISGHIDVNGIGRRWVRKDRKPRYIAQELHDHMGKYTKKKFGWNMRTEGLFCSSDSDLADNFGKSGYPVIVFPIGKFKYIWTDDTTDIYREFDSQRWWDDFDDYVRSEKLATVEDELDKYHTNNLNKLLRDINARNNEIIINCKQYYIINMAWKETLLGYYS